MVDPGNPNLLLFFFLKKNNVILVKKKKKQWVFPLIQLRPGLGSPG
jgi:hypothetical protein